MLAAALLVFLVTASAFRIFTNDLGWHLASGEWILAEGAVPREDPFTSTVRGREWVDHEWGAQVLFALLERAAGLPALVGLRVAVVLLVAAVLVLALRRRGAGTATAALLVAAGVEASRLRLQVRPELATLLIVPLLLLVLTRPGRGERGAAREGLALLGVAALFVVWANLHGGFVLGLAILGCVAMGGTLERALGREDAPSARRLAWAWSAPVAGGLAALANPYGIGVYTVLPRIREAITASGLLNPEWRPPVLARQPLLFVVAAVLAGLTLAAARRQRIATTLVALLLLGYALRFARGTALLGLAFPLLAWEALAALGRSERGARLLRALRGTPRTDWLAAALLAAVALSHVLSTGIPRFGFGLDERLAAVGAADFLLRERPARELYNEIGDGGYLLWRLGPDVPVFLDPRIELFAELLPEWTRAQRDPESWNAFLAAHGVETAVVRYVPVARGEVPRPLGPPTRALFDEGRWALVHFDDHNMVYLKRGPRQAELVARLEYRCLHPELLPDLATRAAADPELLRCLAAELARRQGEQPPSSLVEELARRLARAVDSD